MATNITIQLTPKDIRVLKARTGKRSAGAALKAWVANADPTHTAEELRAAAGAIPEGRINRQRTPLHQRP